MAAPSDYENGDVGLSCDAGGFGHGLIDLQRSTAEAAPIPAIPPKRRGRPRKANGGVISNAGLPSGDTSAKVLVAPHAEARIETGAPPSVAAPADGGGEVLAAMAMPPTWTLPDLAPTITPDAAGHVPVAELESAGQLDIATHAFAAPLSNTLPDLIGEIEDYHRFRMACIKMRIRIDNQCLAQARRVLGWRPNLPEKDRLRIAAKARRLIKGIQKNDIDMALARTVSERNLDLLKDFAAGAQQARAFYVSQQMKLEAHIEERVVELPVYEWVKTKFNFGAGNLGSIVGEAGDIANYGTPSRLWKRMGMAVIDGERQRKVRDPEGAAKHLYSPQRRSTVWNLGDCLIKGGERNPWRQVYLDRKQYEVEKDPTMTKSHAHKRAKRYMEKRALRELWSAWRRGQCSRDTQASDSPSPIYASV